MGLQKLVDAARCKGGEWSSSQVTQCLIAIQSFTPSCVNHDEWYEGLKQDCMEVLTGTENPGAPCGSNFDCFAGAGKYASCTNSNCRVSTFVGLGQACEYIPSGPTSMQCNELDELYCYSGKCASFVPIGSSCAGGAQCVQEASCVSGLCTKRVGAGGACSSSGAQCEPGLRCLSTGVCGGGIGASCSDSLKDCAPQSSCLNGKCAMPKFPLLMFMTSAQCG